MGLFLEYAWLIPFLPFCGFLLLTLTPVRASRVASTWSTTALMAIASILAIGVAIAVAGAGIQAPASEGFAFPEPALVHLLRWAPAGDTAVMMGYLIDPLAAAMLVMVTIASTCIHLFSIGYMAHDARQTRFFSFISLFTAAMLTMVMSSNLLLFFIAWELMGLCSYLLIGFRFEKDYANPAQITPRRAAIKAFITTRIGDSLLLLGLVYLWSQVGTLELGAANGQVFDPTLLARLGSTPAAFGMSTATAIALLLFAGTIGKSAQFPLHVWLPDAMEGPTPVSALIHAATMVAAGVYLVARTFPIFEVSDALPIVAAIGAFTAVFAALIAVAQFDIKRILAYSTISQLGFMVAAMGIGGWVAALFHLLTHAFFKALLFLGSGSVIHGMEATLGPDSNRAQDIRNMGGLRKLMPRTWIAYMAGYLSLAGLPGMAGFWSKDEILADAFNHGHLVIYAMLTIASFLTAFYMTRQVMLVFYGSFRGEVIAEADTPAHAHEAPHESPWTMTVPLLILAMFAILAGYVNLPFKGFHQLSEYLQAESGYLNVLVMVVASLVALAGIALGWYLYRHAFEHASDTDPLERAMPRIFRVLAGKFFIDEFYAATFGRLITLLAAAWTWIDRAIIDALIDGSARLTQFLGRMNFIVDDTVLNDGADLLADGTTSGGDRARQLQTGRIQDYVALSFGGVVIIGVLYLYVFNR